MHNLMQMNFWGQTVRPITRGISESWHRWPVKRIKTQFIQKTNVQSLAGTQPHDSGAPSSVWLAKVPCTEQIDDGTANWMPKWWFLQHFATLLIMLIPCSWATVADVAVSSSTCNQPTCMSISQLWMCVHLWPLVFLMHGCVFHGKYIFDFLGFLGFTGVKTTKPLHQDTTRMPRVCFNVWWSLEALRTRLLVLNKKGSKLGVIGVNVLTQCWFHLYHLIFIAIIWHNYAVDLACLTCPRKKSIHVTDFFQVPPFRFHHVSTRRVPHWPRSKVRVRSSSFGPGWAERGSKPKVPRSRRDWRASYPSMIPRWSPKGWSRFHARGRIVHRLLYRHVSTIQFQGYAMLTHTEIPPIIQKHPPIIFPSDRFGTDFGRVCKANCLCIPCGDCNSGHFDCSSGEMGLEFSWSGMARWDFKALSTLGAERRQSRCSTKLGDVPAVSLQIL